MPFPAVAIAGGMLLTPEALAGIVVAASALFAVTGYYATKFRGLPRFHGMGVMGTPGAGAIPAFTTAGGKLPLTPAGVQETDPLKDATKPSLGARIRTAMAPAGRGAASLVDRALSGMRGAKNMETVAKDLERSKGQESSKGFAYELTKAFRMKESGYWGGKESFEFRPKGGGDLLAKRASDSKPFTFEMFAGRWSPAAQQQKQTQLGNLLSQGKNAVLSTVQKVPEKMREWAADRGVKITRAIIPAVPTRAVSSNNTTSKAPAAPATASRASNSSSRGGGRK